METIRTEAQVGQDGHVRLDVATGCAGRRVEVVVIVNPLGRAHAAGAGYRLCDLSGRLRWSGDAVAAQRRIRDEW
jgi:hypothetical protein